MTLCRYLHAPNLTVWVLARYLLKAFQITPVEKQTVNMHFNTVRITLGTPHRTPILPFSALDLQREEEGEEARKLARMITCVSGTMAGDEEWDWQYEYDPVAALNPQFYRCAKIKVPPPSLSHTHIQRRHKHTHTHRERVARDF